MSDVTIWHNPRCSKSRATLALLQEHGVDPTIRLYQDDPPSESALRIAIEALNTTPADLIRHGDALFKELGLSRQDSAQNLIRAMLAHPRLIERPVVFYGDQAAIGRPPEAVLRILPDGSG